MFGSFMVKVMLRFSFYNLGAFLFCFVLLWLLVGTKQEKDKKWAKNLLILVIDILALEQGPKIINPSGGYPPNERGCRKGHCTFHLSIDKFHLIKLINWNERKSTKHIKVQ